MEASERDPGQEADRRETGGRGVDRRKFLGYSWKLLAAGLVVDAGWTSYDLLRPNTSGGFGGVVEAGSVADYQEGAVQYFPTGRFYVTSASGGLVALFQKCPHLGCRVPFCDSSGRFECPCHGSVYNIRGEYVQGPAPRGMDRFLIKVEGDKVLVDTSQLVEGPARGVTSVSSAPKGASCVKGPGGAATSQAEGAPQ
jgi:cytochrome b6-f complex iron-sulfur subunit